MTTTQIYHTVRSVLQERNYFLILLLSVIIFLVLFVLIPVVTIPGNDVRFQLSIYRSQDYILMIFFAALVGLNLALHTYAWRKQRNKVVAPRTVAQSTATGMLGIFGAIVGTAACASCLASLFGIIGLGTGSVFFVLKNQAYFLTGAIIAMAISRYFAARKVNKVCDSCWSLEPFHHTYRIPL